LKALESAFKIADRITVLDRGRILVTGSVAEVKSSTNERVRGLINRIPENEPVDVDEYMRRLTRLD
jgi:phospholipid/cholesterol/gamma-HCH transport system ATP-binding protein